MHVRYGTRRTGCIAAIVIIVSMTREMGSQGAEAGEFFTAEVAISQMQVAADGQPLAGAAPASRYRLEHRAGANSITRLTLLDRQRDTAESAAGPIPLDNPFLAVTAELDAANGLRLYNPRGERLPEVTAADRRYFGIANPSSSSRGSDARSMSARARPTSLVVTAASRERRAAFEETFGAPVDRVRGLDRYLKRRGDDVDEALIDPATALPVEINMVRKGVLVAHVQMGYEPRGEGTFIRRSFRSERALAESGRRIVTTVDVTNVQVIAGGGQ